MKRYFYFVLALLALVAAIGIACDGTGPSAPGSDSTPTIAYTPLATPTAPAGSTPTTAETPIATPTALADPTPTTAETPLTTPRASDDSTPTMSVAPIATPTAPADPTLAMSDAPLDTVYEELLAAIPDTPEARASVYISDYALVRQMYGDVIPLPGPGDDEDAVAYLNDWLPPFVWSEDEEHLRGFVSLGVQSFFGPFNHRRINLQYFAFDVRNMDQGIVAAPGPAPLEVVRGRFDPQAADKALESCSECPAPSREEHGGVTYYSWGEDYAGDTDMKFAPPAFDTLGRGGRIGVLDEYVFRTLGTSEMKALIDANLNEVPSLADVEEFRLRAGGMFHLGAYVMFLSDDVEVWELDGLARLSLGEGASQEDIEKVKQNLVELGPRLRPYEAYAIGAGGNVEDGPYMALVLVHADGASAEENAGLLRRRIEEGSSTYNGLWSDNIDVGRLEINAEGGVLMAKLRGDLARGWLDWVYRRDGLILYE